MKLSSILIPVIFVASLSCNKDTDKDQEFCDCISQGDYLESLHLINDFLKGLNYEDAGNLGENSGLEQLEDWLVQKPCILEAEITCFWCYYSNPPLGELSIFLKKDSDTLTLTLIGSIPHEAGGLF